LVVYATYAKALDLRHEYGLPKPALAQVLSASTHRPANGPTPEDYHCIHCPDLAVSRPKEIAENNAWADNQDAGDHDLSEEGQCKRGALEDHSDLQAGKGLKRGGGGRKA
jgi:hypothetical protein